MDAKELEGLLVTAVGEDVEAAEGSVILLSKFAASDEFQDFEVSLPLYDSFWIAITTCWLRLTSVARDDDFIRLDEIEKQLLKIFFLLMDSPEFDATVAAQSAHLNPGLPDLLFKRILVKCSSLMMLQLLIHWIYKSREDLRPIMRRNMCSALTSKGTAGGPGDHKVQHMDMGRSRNHVASILGVLLCIIEGIISFHPSVHSGLLQNVLMPLHQPNEMVEWRDQIPAIQLYHEPLVQCIKALIVRSRLCPEISIPITNAEHSDDNSTRTLSNNQTAGQDSILPGIPRSDGMGKSNHRDSLLLTALKCLLQYWPLSASANTPKAVLMIHELESLATMLSPVRKNTNENTSTNANTNIITNIITNNERKNLNSLEENTSIEMKNTDKSDFEFRSFLPLFLDRIVLSLGKGGDSDNFRTTQRALQIFKNKTILDIFRNQHSSEKEVEKQGGPKCISLVLVFNRLIPALYRDGKLSWNPTVNKMTVLALKNLSNLDEELFQICCDKLSSSDNNSNSLENTKCPNTKKTSKISETAANIPQSQPNIHKKMRPPLPASEMKKIQGPVQSQELGSDSTSSSSGPFGLLKSSSNTGVH